MTDSSNVRRTAGFSVLLASLAPCLLGQNFTATGEPVAAPREGDSLIVRAAQVPGPADQVFPIHTAAADDGVAYGIWGAGPGYKISFHDGATFVPLLGREYPHNQPWSWSTASVTLGGVELANRAPALTYTDHRAEYALGGVVEAYDLQPGGVEQTFVIPQRLGAGDLVVRGVVTSLLQADGAAAAHQGLVFRDARGLEIVTYGAATAVDADGNRRQMTTAYENGQVTLRLDEQWLQAARFPVVVDPLLGPGDQIAGNTRYEMDVVRDSETSTEPNWIAYSTYASGLDSDLYVRRYEDNGDFGSTPYYDVTSSWSTRNPSCAYNANSNSGLIAFDRYFPGTGNRGVRIHRHLRSDYTLGTTYASLYPGDNAWRADIGGTRFNSPGNKVMVVWQQESNNGAGFQSTNASDVYGATYDCGTDSFGAPFAIATGVLYDAERPSINQFSTGLSGNNSWLVACQERFNVALITPDDFDVTLREVDVNGLVGSTMVVDSSFDDHKYAPRVEGGSGRYLVSFVSRPVAAGVPSNLNGRQLRAVRINWPTGAGMGSAPHGTVVIDSYSDDRIVQGGLAADRNTESHWALLYRSNVTNNIYMQTVGFRGQVLQTETVWNASGSQTTLAGGVSFDAMANEYTIAYAVNDTGSGYATMDRFDYPTVAAAWTTGTACSTANIEWVGSQQIGSQFSGIHVDGAANDSIHVAALALSTVSAPLFNVGPIQNGCWLLIPNTGPSFLGLLDLRVGSDVTWELPLPEFLTPDVYYAQGWHTVGGGNFDFVSTQRLAVPTTK